MAKKVSLVIYGLSILNKENKRALLNDLNDNKSFLDFFLEFVNRTGKKYSNDSEKETVFQFEQIEVEDVFNDEGQLDYRILYGRVKTGEYGIESELVNIGTGAVYHRSKEQADVMPFGFCIAIPSGDINSAIIILQALGNYGMKLPLQKRLQKCITDINPEYNLLMRAIAPKEYLDRYFEHGVLQKIRMIRYEIPEDISNRMGINYGVKQTKEERIIHKPLGFMEANKKAFQEWRSGQKSYTQIIEIEGYEYDDLKLEFKLGKTVKTFNLGNLEKLVVSEDVTDEVLQSGGHPVFSSLKDKMKDTAKEYLEGMGLIV